MKKPKVIAVHLLNDFSGSPFVFGQALEALHKDGFEVNLFTATPSGKGFLNGLPVVINPLVYRWSKHKWLTLFYFLISQLTVFLKVLFISRKNDLVYINTMLPFGAALAGKLRGSKVVYHIHEVSVKPVSLRKILLFIVKHTAAHCIYVSEYVRNATALQVPDTVVYNALPEEFVRKAALDQPASTSGFTALMLCSLKIYKGVFEFLECAEILPQIQFELVLNASQTEINSFFGERLMPDNVKIYAAQSDVHPFYQRASVLLNLSLPDKWVETFGMTVLEAMYYAKPVIVPPIGGVVELVENGANGYCIDATNQDLICMRIQSLAENHDLYTKMSKAAFEKANLFTQSEFSSGICRVANSIVNDKGKTDLAMVDY
ncbi:MAG: glycosyltransferase family 4 protein [Bacteroidetes bacterium]|nr:glycosyltransferase family 4 protein [Bacteroidota bacterium]